MDMSIFGHMGTERSKL